jgi:signal transduction histidine kinase
MSAAWRQSGRVVLAGLASGLLTVVCGAPYWCEHVVHAVVAALACAGFAASGALLATGGVRWRLTGRLLLTASFCWPIAWLVAWNSGAAPMIGLFAQGIFFVLAGAALLSYPAGRLDGRRERIFLVAAAVVLLGGESTIQLVSRPEWDGLAPDVVWPHVVDSRGAWNVAIRATALGQVVLACWFALLLFLRARWLSRLDRRIAIPVLVAAASLGLVSSVQAVVQTEAWTNLAALESFYFTQGVLALLTSAALVSGALRDRWWELHAPHRVVRDTASRTSVATVRKALSEALRDDTLQLLFWAPVEAGWVDERGRPVAVGPAPVALAGKRWRLPIAADDASPLALVEVDAALQERPELVDAVLRAGTQALLTAQLQAAASAHLGQVVAAQARLEEMELAERRRLEQDLRTGARRQLRELAQHLERLADVDPNVRACRDEALATIGELESLARGLLPPELRAEGLAAALAAVAGRLGLSVRLDVVAGRLPAGTETALYFALCEGLTNVAKHARDANVDVTVATQGGRVYASVVDDGPGGAVIAPGGGLAGLQERVLALRGTATLESASGAGTRLSLDLPLAGELVTS